MFPLKHKPTSQCSHNKSVASPLPIDNGNHKDIPTKDNNTNNKSSVFLEEQSENTSKLMTEIFSN
jgi:hypothetical protein